MHKMTGVNMIIAFCGHSNYVQNIHDKEKILNILEIEAGEAPCEIFLGGYGGFDAFAFQCVKEFKRSHSNAKLSLVTPYLKKKKDFLQAGEFDSVIYPNLEHVPPRYAISHRNRWMIGQADVVISHVSHQYGGAYAMYLVAKQKAKKIYNLGSLQ